VVGSVVTLLAGNVASGSSITFTGTYQGTWPGGDPGEVFDLSASVVFEKVGSDLTVLLTNTGPDAVRPSDVLTTVFFETADLGTPTLVSALLPAGSSVVFPNASSEMPGVAAYVAAGDVSGEWAYRQGFAGPEGTTHGISSTGLGIFGPSDRFGTVNLDGPDAGGGMSYGIVSADDDPASGNPQMTGSRSFIRDEVRFLLSDVPDGFDPAEDITNVWFKYGTDLQEQPRFPGDPRTPTPAFDPIPEPMTMVTLSCALAWSGVYVRRRRR
jgi:hypothetical protein